MKKIIAFLLCVLVLGGLFGGYLVYQKIFAANIDTKGVQTFLKIPTGSTFDAVLDSLKNTKVVKDLKSFERIAAYKKYPEAIKPGRYELKNGISNNQLINLLRSGKQEPLKVTFNNARTKADLARKIANYLEFDSLAMIKHLNDNAFWAKNNITPELVTSRFIPNTYNFFWNTSPQQFSERMMKEYEKFWNSQRKQKAKAIQFSPEEVMTLAAIVQSETAKKDEAPKVAGVYLNRIRQGIPLQADPTLIFAVGDFTIKRVLNEHKAIQSPYNTYLNAGLPPGPIAVPEIYAIDAVLENQRHEYLYFCAKEDFSGYHNFASNYNEHLKNANRYQKALNERKIFK